MSLTLVTGAAGNIASRVVRRLAARNVQVRAFIRKGDARPSDGRVDVFEGDLANREQVRAAMKGVSKVYLLSTGLDVVGLEGNVTDAAAAEKVGLIVKHSMQQAPTERGPIPRNHRASEKHIEASKVPYTFLRPAAFASNALGWAGMLKGGDKVYGPYGDAALPVLDPEDLAAVAEKVLTEDGHAGKAYELTGPVAITATEQVAVLGKVLGRSLTYVNVPDEAAQKSMVDAGMPAGYADSMIELVRLLRELGRVAPAPAVEMLLGRPAASFEAFVKANASVFR